MSATIRRVLFNGVDMAEFKLLDTKTVSNSGTSYTIAVDSSITEVICIVHNAAGYECYWKPYVFGRVLSSSTGSITSTMNGYHAILLNDTYSYTTINYNDPEYCGSIVNNYGSRYCGIQSGNSVYSGTILYIYGR